MILKNAGVSAVGRNAQTNIVGATISQQQQQQQIQR